jgi:hypothetical protein
MSRNARIGLLFVLLLVATACAAPETPVATTFADDLSFLEQHTEIVLLHDAENRALVAVAPEYQGRVMTSTAEGDAGPSLGWIHRPGISADEYQPHMNVFGGEDRFWLGPEGGQFAIFFLPGDPFDLDHWQTPEPIDWGGWEVVDKSPERVSFRRSMQFENYSGTKLELEAEREIRLLEIDTPSGVAQVAFESDNTIRNTGDAEWTHETGQLSIWILGVFPPSPSTTVVLPFVEGPQEELGPIVNDAYFGPVPADRLRIGNGVVFFSGDGRQRGKIGLSRRRAKSVMGSYDADLGVLTIVEFTLPDDAVDYVSSLWEIQERPFRGDVSNSYNDGPPEPGVPPLGPFYELESSSPAAALAPGEELHHLHRTVHYRGPSESLDPVARERLGVSLAEIEAAFD